MSWKVETWDGAIWTLVPGIIGNNYIANGEFETNIDGWTPQNLSTHERSSDQSANDVYSMKMVRSGSSAGSWLAYEAIAGKTYRIVVKTYGPSSNVGTKARVMLGLSLMNNNIYEFVTGDTDVGFTTEDAWVTWTYLYTAGSTQTVYLSIYTPTSNGDIEYVDDVSIYEINNDKDAWPNHNNISFSPALETTQMTSQLANGSEVRLLPETKSIRKPFTLFFDMKDNYLRKALEDYVQNGTELRITESNSKITFQGAIKKITPEWYMGENNQYFAMAVLFDPYTIN